MHKLDLNVFEDDNFVLIAIHSALEEHRLSYFINQILDIQLKRAEKDLDFNYKSVQAVYTLYKFHDEANMCNFYLVNNKFKGKPNVTISSGSLFSEEPDAVTTYLISEFKKVDYFLKIEDGSEKVTVETLHKLNKVSQIDTAYTIEYSKIRNKENLIFE